MDKPNLKGYIILGRYGDLYMGPIECSFSLDISYERTQFFWSSKIATSNFGGKFEIDGLEWAKESLKRLEKDHPGIKFQIYDVHDENIPFELDWDEWREACKPADTLSGVKDKFKARNVKFKIKEINKC